MINLAIGSRKPINIVDYGAKCDGHNDDANSINLAVEAWRSQQNAKKNIVLEFPEAGSCLIRSPINLTNVSRRGTIIEGNGATLVCEGSRICVDATGTVGMNIFNLSVEGSRRDPPEIGIQWARESLTIGCSEDNVSNLVVQGQFKFTPVYIEECEDMSWTNSHIENDYAGMSTWLVVEDGINHWDARSTFQQITIGHDEPHGMDELVWINPLFWQKGPGHMMWLANSHSTELLGEAYGNSSYGAAPFVLYETPKTNNGNLVVDMYFEEVHQESAFEIEGPNPVPIIYGLKWHERGVQPLKYIFSHSPNIKLIKLEDVDIGLYQSYIAHPPVPKMFDNPTAWSMSGDIFLPSPTWWNTPSSWTGCITTLSSARECSLGSVIRIEPLDPVVNLIFADSGDTTYDITATKPLALNLTGGTPGQAQRLTVVLRLQPGASGLVTLPKNVIWPGSHKIRLGQMSGAIEVITFLTVDGGQTYFGLSD
ncbi:hypothetical protein [Lichenicola sp.]|uniref:hypothetical protein n=1 Tax=Lichenicola sp. TaxID=2804529 RepID=UPI003B005837